MGQPVKTDLVRTRVVEQLRQEILGQDLAPGQKLVERVLCERTGASRTALREGLRQLEAEGLVEIIPNRGPQVPSLSAEQVSQIYEMRICLESHMARRASERATGHDINVLYAIGGGVTEAIAARDRRALIAAKERFYDWLFALSGNEEMILSMRRLLGRSSLIWPRLATQDLSVMAGSAEELDGIVSALASHDGPLAAQRVTAHLEAALGAVLAHLAGYRS